MVYCIVFEKGARIRCPDYEGARRAVLALVKAGFVAWVEGVLS
jgi:hypothetical protein